VGGVNHWIRSDATPLLFKANYALIWSDHQKFFLQVSSGTSRLDRPRLVKPIRRHPESSIRVPQRQSAFHPRAQPNAFRRHDARR